MKSPIRILLVEDHPTYRKVIEMALKNDPDMEMTGMFGAAEIALRSVQDLRRCNLPDVVLLDLNLPGMNGLEALPWFNKYTPKTNVIVLTQSDSEADVLRAIQNGAAGYLRKSSTINQIKDSIRTVVNGGSSLDGKVAKFILTTLKKNAPKPVMETTLSSRELEILTLIAEGLVKKEIGDRLDIRFSSVATYIRRIYKKLDVPNAPAAINKAYQTGLFSSKN